ncbi:hypothetical protein Tco_0663643, partial [Tanacetum coccineum]
AIEGDAPASYGDYSDRESTDCDNVKLNVERGVGDGGFITARCVLVKIVTLS